MKRSPFLSDQMRDIHAMLNSGFGWLTRSRFLLLTIREGCEDQARKWLSDVVQSDLMISARHVKESKKDEPGAIREAVAIAFSFPGLTALGLRETSTHPFPTPFRSGMGSALREPLLRDDSRDQWTWSDVEGFDGRQTVHVLVAQWWQEGELSRMPEPGESAFSDITPVENRWCSFCDGKLYEPFGFRDGIAQPVIRGLRDQEGHNPKRVKQDAGVFYEDRVIDPGEFVLGYRNQYDELTYTPDVEHWAESGRATHPGARFTLNGSYLAVRQIEQKVELFKEFEKTNGLAICAKMMGREKSGLPLSWDGPSNTQVSDSTADAFRYQVNDANGFMCPQGAHIHRANPRDSLGVDVKSGIKSSKLHRLLRRGRPYLETTEDGNKKSEGLFFIACNADLERQFEFICQRWVRNFRFQDLHHQDDPVVGSYASKKFTIPGLPSGDDVSLKTFTETLGGGYFFLPGMAALKFVLEQSALGSRG